MDTLHLIHSNVPTGLIISNWNLKSGFVEFQIEIDENSGSILNSYQIKASKNGDKILVKEVGSNKKLPTNCPCRHINYDATFCIRPDPIELHSSADAEVWWEDLKEFLQLQKFAGQNGYWPPSKEWSHGDAAECEKKARIAANNLNVLQEYKECVGLRTDFLKKLAEELFPEMLLKNSKDMFNERVPFLNGRASCPKGCKHKSNTPILRRDCLTNKSKFVCDTGRSIRHLIDNEILRQIKSHEFVEKHRSVTCNTDMKYCEFRDRKNPHP